jgi:hypothetical protein
MMLLLSRSDPLVPEFSPFMLDVCEVVDSPAELPKCVTTQIEQELKLLLEAAKTKYSSFVGTDDNQGHCQASTRCSSFDQAMFGWWRGKNHDNLGGWGGG